MRFLFFFSLFSTACQTSKNNCFLEENLTAGTATLTLDGTEMEYQSSWLMTGSNLQINLNSNGDNSMLTLRLLESADGVGIADMEAGSSYSFVIGDPSSATATLYPPDTNTSATASSDEIGELNISLFDGNQLQACFSFAAVDNDGQVYQVEQGLVYAMENMLE